MNRKLLKTAGRVDQRRLAICAHEIGHALTWLEHGIEIEEVRLKTGFFGGFSGGFCDTVDTPSRDWSRAMRQGYLIGLMGGHAAEVRFCQLYLEMPAKEAFTFGREWAEGDYLNYSYWRSKLGLGGFSWSGGMSSEEAFDRASLLLDKHHRRLDELTLRLECKGRLDGGEL